MTTSEKALWQWLRKANSEHIFLYRVENGVGSGQPDVQGFIRGYGSIYIELKDGVYPKRESTFLKFDVRASQEYWHNKMTKLGSTGHHFLIQIEGDRYWIPGKWATLLREGVSRDWLNHYRFDCSAYELFMENYFGHWR